MKKRTIIMIFTIIIFCLGIVTFIKFKFTYKNNVGDIKQVKANVSKEVKSYNKGNNTSNKNNSQNKDDIDNKTNIGNKSQADNKNNASNKGIEYLNKNPKDVYIPILMYHSISSANSSNNLLVPPKQFEEQIKWLKKNGFTPLSMDEVVKALKTGKVPKRPVAITFDDGYIDNYTDAYRILKKYDMKGTFFIIADCIGDNKIYLTMDMLKEMRDNGMNIESHTLNHLELNKISKDEKIKSIKGAKDFLKDKLGIESKYLCYPVGRYDEETIKVSKELGIEAAVTTTKGFANLNNGLYSLKRVRMFPMDIETFKETFNDYMK